MAEIAEAATALLAELQATIREHEFRAVEDIDRMDAENRQRKEDRWRRMQDETRDLRRQASLIVDELAKLRGYEVSSVIVPPSHSVGE